MHRRLPRQTRDSQSSLRSTDAVTTSRISSSLPFIVPGLTPSSSTSRASTNRGLSGWQTERGQDNDRDLRLVDSALDSLRKKYSIDDSRIYATGFSNGAGFTFLLWTERPNVFAAYAVVAGRLRPSVQPKQPRPMLHVAGVSDAQIAYADQRAAIVTAIAVNGVRSQSERCGNGCTIYGGSTPSPVVTWIHPGGHEYPRGTSERIVDFFQKHALKK
jgi:polyhydroxybutyrate depolymerase